MIHLAAVLLLTPPAPAENLVFKDTKQMIQKGDESDDREVALVLDEAERILVVRHRKKEDEVYATIPYDSIGEMTYERSTHPRTKTAILVSPFALFSKSKKHWLTISFEAAGKNDFVLLQLDKKDYKQILAAIEAQTGKNIERVIES